MGSPQSIFSAFPFPFPFNHSSETLLGLTFLCQNCPAEKCLPDPAEERAEKQQPHRLQMCEVVTLGGDDN